MAVDLNNVAGATQATEKAQAAAQKAQAAQEAVDKASSAVSAASSLVGPMAVKPNKEANPSQKYASELSPGAAASISQKTSVVPAMSSDDAAILGPFNTGIFQGQDRLAEVGTGNPDAGAIYIVAGMSERFPVKNPTQEDGSIGLANRNPNLDNSFIYLSSKSDIDRSLNLAKGNMGEYNGAAIVVKSSNLRFIARNGVKIVCGTDISNEHGTTSVSNVGVELISGNDSDGTKLQPIVKGDNLAKALTDLSTTLDQTLACLMGFVNFQFSFNLELAKHTHPDILNIAVGTIAQGNPLAVRDGKTEMAFPVLTSGVKTNTGLMEITYKGAKLTRQNLINVVNEYYDVKKGNNNPNDIRSRFHMVN